MVVVDNAAIGADGDVDARFLKVFITLSAHVDECSRLSAPNAFRLTRDADRTAADADFDEVRPRIRKEAEPLAVDNIARTNLYTVAELLTDVLNCQALPLGEPLRRVNAEDIHARRNQRRNTLCIVARVDTGTNNITLIAVGQLELILLVVGVILAEYHVA